jgi:hypothetical protein
MSFSRRKDVDRAEGFAYDSHENTIREAEVTVVLTKHRERTVFII